MKFGVGIMSLVVRTCTYYFSAVSCINVTDAQSNEVAG
jgi:hypothetical protein